MSMKVTRLYTHWTADEAHAVIELLDRLRDELWEHYGEAIIASLKDASVGAMNDDQLPLPGLDDELPF